jgi:hypothetical protein
MTVSILQSNYIPWKGYFDIIAKSDVFVIYDEVQYTKNDWRNRNKILTPNGTNWLTIPVRVDSLNQKICETKVASINWNKKHFTSLQLNYSKAKGYKEFKDILSDLYDNPPELLTEINIRFIKTICNYLGIKTKIIDSRDLNLNGDRNERLIDACEKLSADIYLSGPSAKNYIDVALFEQSKLKLEWMDYSNYITYEQMHEPFIHNVSIIDLILNNGSNSKDFIYNCINEK